MTHETELAIGVHVFISISILPFQIRTIRILATNIATEVTAMYIDASPCACSISVLIGSPLGVCKLLLSGQGIC